ncbi:mucin-5AC [Hyalella azteca]|uniref:Mucin-5AC n=1 Tax=Hyalella azteca TaxID=294128 RepID=A0A979FHC6_HYAAZ|nr:mucin-5AC [Hyalella azteca]
MQPPLLPAQPCSQEADHCSDEVAADTAPVTSADALVTTASAAVSSPVKEQQLLAAESPKLSPSTPLPKHNILQTPDDSCLTPHDTHTLHPQDSTHSIPDLPQNSVPESPTPSSPSVQSSSSANSPATTPNATASPAFNAAASLVSSPHNASPSPASPNTSSSSPSPPRVASASPHYSPITCDAPGNQAPIIISFGAPVSCSDVRFAAVGSSPVTCISSASGATILTSLAPTFTSVGPVATSATFTAGATPGSISYKVLPSTASRVTALQSNTAPSYVTYTSPGSLLSSFVPRPASALSVAAGVRSPLRVAAPRIAMSQVMTPQPAQPQQAPPQSPHQTPTAITPQSSQHFYVQATMTGPAMSISAPPAIAPAPPPQTTPSSTTTTAGQQHHQATLPTLQQQLQHLQQQQLQQPLQQPLHPHQIHHTAVSPSAMAQFSPQLQVIQSSLPAPSYNLTQLYQNAQGQLIMPGGLALQSMPGNATQSTISPAQAMQPALNAGQHIQVITAGGKATAFNGQLTAAGTHMLTTAQLPTAQPGKAATATQQVLHQSQGYSQHSLLSSGSQTLLLSSPISQQPTNILPAAAAQPNTAAATHKHQHDHMQKVTQVSTAFSPGVQGGLTWAGLQNPAVLAAAAAAAQHPQQHQQQQQQLQHSQPSIIFRNAQAGPQDNGVYIPNPVHSTSPANIQPKVTMSSNGNAAAMRPPLLPASLQPQQLHMTHTLGQSVSVSGVVPVSAGQQQQLVTLQQHQQQQQQLIRPIASASTQTGVSGQTGKHQVRNGKVARKNQRTNNSNSTNVNSLALTGSNNSISTSLPIITATGAITNSALVTKGVQIQPMPSIGQHPNQIKPLAPLTPSSSGPIPAGLPQLVRMPHSHAGGLKTTAMALTNATATLGALVATSTSTPQQFTSNTNTTSIMVAPQPATAYVLPSSSVGVAVSATPATSVGGVLTAASAGGVLTAASGAPLYTQLAPTQQITLQQQQQFQHQFQQQQQLHFQQQQHAAAVAQQQSQLQQLHQQQQQQQQLALQSQQLGLQPIAPALMSQQPSQHITLQPVSSQAPGTTAVSQQSHLQQQQQLQQQHQLQQHQQQQAVAKLQQAQPQAISAQTISNMATTSLNGSAVASSAAQTVSSSSNVVSNNAFPENTGMSAEANCASENGDARSSGASTPVSSSSSGTKTPVPEAGATKIHSAALSSPVAPSSGAPKAIVKPQVLTHVIEGFVIHEASEPFPVCRSSLLSDLNGVKVNGKVPSDGSNRVSVNGTAHLESELQLDSKCPSSSAELPNGQAASPGKLVDVGSGRCEACGKPVDGALCKSGAKTKLSKNKRFCSVACSRKITSGQQKRALSSSSPRPDGGSDATKRFKEDLAATAPLSARTEVEPNKSHPQSSAVSPRLQSPAQPLMTNSPAGALTPLIVPPLGGIVPPPNPVPLGTPGVVAPMQLTPAMPLAPEHLPPQVLPPVQPVVGITNTAVAAGQAILSAECKRDSSAPSPVLMDQSTPTKRVGGGPANYLTTDIPQWTVQDVVQFILNLPGCQDYAEDFELQEIDGQALMLLKADHLMNAMSIKLGPALKICAKIEAMRGEKSSPQPAPQ